MIIWRILMVFRVRGFMQKIWTSLIRCKPRPWYLLFSFVLFRPNIVLWYPEVALAGAPRWKPCNCWSEPNGIVAGARQEKWNPKLKFQTGPPPIDFIFKRVPMFLKYSSHPWWFTRFGSPQPLISIQDSKNTVKVRNTNWYRLVVWTPPRVNWDDYSQYMEK